MCSSSASSPFFDRRRCRCFSLPVLFLGASVILSQHFDTCIFAYNFSFDAMCLRARLVCSRLYTESQKLPHLICSDIVPVGLSFLRGAGQFSLVFFLLRKFFHLILLWKINPFLRATVCFRLFRLLARRLLLRLHHRSTQSNERGTSNASHNVKGKQKNRLTFLNKHWDSSGAVPSIVNPACIITL